MNTMKWLLRREMWEHRGSLLWAPGIVSLLLILLIGGGLAFGIVAGKGMVLHVNDTDIVRVDGVPAAMREQLGAFLSSVYLGFSAPLLLVLAFVVFFYCLSALYDERRDRSVLFWKSLPISDTQTVLSKVATALLLAPLIMAAMAIINGLVILVALLIVGGFYGANLFVPVLSQLSLYLTPLHLLSLLPVYILWALPTVGWLLMVSAWARSKPFLWAVGLPLGSLAVLSWLNFVLVRFTGQGINVGWFGEEVVIRLLLGLVPGIWFGDVNKPPTIAGETKIDTSQFVALSYESLAEPLVWAGAIAGCLMIYAAIRLRRWRDEG